MTCWKHDKADRLNFPIYFNALKSSTECTIESSSRFNLMNLTASGASAVSCPKNINQFERGAAVQRKVDFSPCLLGYHES